VLLVVVESHYETVLYFLEKPLYYVAVVRGKRVHYCFATLYFVFHRLWEFVFFLCQFVVDDGGRWELVGDHQVELEADHYILGDCHIAPFFLFGVIFLLPYLNSVVLLPDGVGFPERLLRSLLRFEQQLVIPVLDGHKIVSDNLRVDVGGDVPNFDSGFVIKVWRKHPILIFFGVAKFGRVKVRVPLFIGVDEVLAGPQFAGLVDDGLELVFGFFGGEEDVFEDNHQQVVDFGCLLL
jgi:hypothetical protein